MAPKTKTEVRLLYYDKKNRCPRCNSKDLAETSLGNVDVIEVIKKYGDFRDRKNKTACKNCGWQGCIDDLKP